MTTESILKAMVLGTLALLSAALMVMVQTSNAHAQPADCDNPFTGKYGVWAWDADGDPVDAVDEAYKAEYISSTPCASDAVSVEDHPCYYIGEQGPEFEKPDGCVGDKGPSAPSSSNSYAIEHSAEQGTTDNSAEGVCYTVNLDNADLDDPVTRAARDDLLAQGYTGTQGDDTDILYSPECFSTDSPAAQVSEQTPLTQRGDPAPADWKEHVTPVTKVASP